MPCSFSPGIAFLIPSSQGAALLIHRDLANAFVPVKCISCLWGTVPCSQGRLPFAAVKPRLFSPRECTWLWETPGAAQSERDERARPFSHTDSLLGSGFSVLPGPAACRPGPAARLRSKAGFGEQLSTDTARRLGCRRLELRVSSYGDLTWANRFP